MSLHNKALKNLKANRAFFSALLTLVGMASRYNLLWYVPRGTLARIFHKSSVAPADLTPLQPTRGLAGAQRNALKHPGGRWVTARVMTRRQLRRTVSVEASVRSGEGAVCCREKKATVSFGVAHGEWRGVGRGYTGRTRYNSPRRSPAARQASSTRSTWNSSASGTQEISV